MTLPPKNDPLEKLKKVKKDHKKSTIEKIGPLFETTLKIQIINALENAS